MKPIRSLALVLVVAGLAACAGSGNADPEVTAPLPTVAPTTDDGGPSETDVTTMPNTVAETTKPTEPPTETTTAVEPGGFLPADLGTPVDGAPGVDTPGEIVELIDNVWIFVPTEPDPNDANVVPPLPEDIEIITAYAEAQAAYHEQASMNPMPAEPSDRVVASLADAGARLAENIFAPKSAAGQYLDLTDGIVLRPVVIADPRSDTEAFIFDCQLDGTVFVNSDGSLADGQTPGVKEFPQIASIVKVGDDWIVDRLTRDDRACV